MTWRPIDTAPKDRSFLARQDGEIYTAKYTQETPPRLAFRIHKLRVPSHYEIVKITHKGELVEAQIPIGKPWPEYFEHHWTFWTRGFEFAPTEWAEIP